MNEESFFDIYEKHQDNPFQFTWKYLPKSTKLPSEPLLCKGKLITIDEYKIPKLLTYVLTSRSLVLVATLGENEETSLNPIAELQIKNSRLYKITEDKL